MPPSTQTPHRTPLRRISQGSLFRLSRSSAYPDAPHGLGFLEPAMAEFLDEVEALQTNMENMKQLSNSLETFNESFASWLYIVNMNALTIDWTQAPADTSFMLAKRRAEESAIAAENLLQAAALAREAQILADKTAVSEMTEPDTTYAANITTGNTTSVTSISAKSGTVTKKKVGGKPKLSVKEKKERGIEIERIISCLPLEFRGSDPSLRRNMETVIEGLMNAPGNTVKLPDLIKPPDLNQARVNKCLIALVNRKAVQKDSSSGTMLYRWQGIL